jgi:hypothetical protein
MVIMGCYWQCCTVFALEVICVECGGGLGWLLLVLKKFDF